MSVYKGLVTQNTDPEGLGRIKALVPQILGPLESEWAWPAGPNIASIVPLAIGEPVWVMFEGDDVNHPVWIGTWAVQGATLDILPVSSVDPTALNAEIAARVRKLYAIRCYASQTFR